MIKMIKNDKNDYYEAVKAPTDERSLTSSKKKLCVFKRERERERERRVLLLRIIIPRDRQKRRRRTRGLVLGPVGASFRESFLRRRRETTKAIRVLV